MQATSKASTPTEVHVRVHDDADAVRITAVLEALGFRVVRLLDDADGGTRLRWAVDRLSRLHHLTEREREVLAGVLEGHHNERLATKLGISRATVKWHLHNVFAKIGVASREALLRVALELAPEPDVTPTRHWAGPHDETLEIE
jgi:DNA-binding CsgD family transcriptional regulator